MATATLPPATLSPVLQRALDQSEKVRASNLERHGYEAGDDAAALESFVRQRAAEQEVHPAIVARRMQTDGPLYHALCAERDLDISRELYPVWQRLRARHIPPYDGVAVLAHVLGKLVEDLLSAAGGERSTAREILEEYLEERERPDADSELDL